MENKDETQNGSAVRSTDMVRCLEKVYDNAVEFLNDWTKGDFDLPPLARCDAASLKEACLAYERERKTFMAQCSAIINEAKTPNASSSPKPPQ